ncbi:MAG: hypothetical protein AVDCRST_MAG34-1947 [uncultured Nocardioidaceae bacterium]|uniref:DNA-directed RNA polymerase subunit beta n=1 Tax=uncultured Nocardioidaceae bacterium TaxID=253824 RepID=A0A6J4MCI6_9ACTN|nr:MAG: hypothetical protein AVDCRST_MAG34-1947 [uncultured Nocardioidaceae bacterium]
MHEPESPRHHRPALPGAGHFEAVVGGLDPAVRSEAADRCATLLVRGPRDQSDTAIVDRIVHLADAEGLDEIAALWSGSPADSLAGCLWRLYLLRAWVYADPAAAAHEFDLGRRHLPVHEVVAGVTEPPGPDDVRRLADTVLKGVRVGDFADTLFRAAAFARVAAAGRAHREHADTSSYASDLSAARLMTMAEQLEAAGRLELTGRLA